MGRVLLLSMLLVSASAGAQTRMVPHAPPVSKKLQLPPPEGMARHKLPKALDLSLVVRLEGWAGCHDGVEKTAAEAVPATPRKAASPAVAAPKFDGCMVIRRDTTAPFGAGPGGTALRSATT